MRVLFIYPNLNAQIGFNYGLAYISGLLKANGIETHLLNVNDQIGYPLDLERIKKDVLRIGPDIVGFSVSRTSTNIPWRSPVILKNTLMCLLYSGYSSNHGP
jgi:hypothetical protein